MCVWVFCLNSVLSSHVAINILSAIVLVLYEHFTSLPHVALLIRTTGFIACKEKIKLNITEEVLTKWMRTIFSNRSALKECRHPNMTVKLLQPWVGVALDAYFYQHPLLISRCLSYGVYLPTKWTTNVYLSFLVRMWGLSSSSDCVIVIFLRVKN